MPLPRRIPPRVPAMRLLLLFAVLILTGRVAGETDPLSTLRAGHPRLLFTDEQLAAAKQAAQADPLRADLHRYILAAAQAQWKEEPIAHVLIGPRMLDQSRRAVSQVLTNAMAYRLSGDRRFANYARDQMLRAAAFPDWNPSHFLDVAEMATALAIGYDWLYSQLTPAERATIKKALLEKCLSFAEPAYTRRYPDRESFPFVLGNLTNNWNQVCNGGFVMAALALADEEPEMARRVIAGMRETLPHAMTEYAPDGGYPEGPVYWGYGTRYNIYILAALQTALGQDFGLSSQPGFDRTVMFRVHAASPIGLSFNFADGRPTLGADDAITWLAQRFHQPYAEAMSRTLLADLLRTAPQSETVRFLTMHAITFPALPTTRPSPPPLDVQFNGHSKVAIFRSAWNDRHAVWTGLKAGSNFVNHGHLDLGSFMLDADGVRWAVDLGPDDYNLPGYWDRARVTSPRWKYYRLNNLSHNTLTPAGLLQTPAADGAITRFVSRPERAFAIADMSSAYPGTATKIERGLALIERRRVLIQDELTALNAGTPLIWRMLTGTQVRIEDPHRAVLTQDGRTLRIEILAPADATFSTHPARPPTAAENQNDGITALEAAIPARTQATDVRVVVLLTPGNIPASAPEIQPLSDWR